MKRIHNTNYTDSHMKVLLMWALVPALFIALAIVSVKWYVCNFESSTDSFPTNDDIEWGKVISNSPDVIFETTDSLKYYRYAERELFKRSNIQVANVSNLFPDFNATLLLLEKQDPILTFDKGGTFQMFEARQKHGGVFYGKIHRSKDGNFYLSVLQDSIKSKSNVPLGRFSGTLNLPPKKAIDVVRTTLNVVAIVALMLCLIGAGIMLGSNTPNRNVDTEYIFYAVVISTALLALYVGFWLFDGPAFFGKRYDYPEWIAVAWLLSEVGLLGGILYKMKVENNLPTPPQKSEKE